MRRHVGKIAGALAGIAVLAVVGLLLYAGSDSKKPAAEAALREAEQAVAAVVPESRPYVPAMVDDTLTILAGAKKQLAQGEYKAVLASAEQLKLRADEMRRATAERKAAAPK